MKRWDTYAYLLSGFFLIAGLLQPHLSFLFYFAFVFPTWALIKQQVSNAGMFYFWLPYFLVVGIGAWLPVFPYSTGLILAVLSCFLLANLFYLLQVKVEIPGSRLLLLPAGFFLFEYIFHSLPCLSFVELPLMLGVVSSHTWLVRMVLLLGSSLSLFVIICGISVLTAVVVERKIERGSLAVMVGAALLIGAANMLAGSSLAEPGQGVRIAAVQGSTGGETAELRGEEYADFLFGRYSDMTRCETADIFVWPEVTTAFYFPENEKYRGQAFVDLAREKSALIVPVVREYKRKSEGGVSGGAGNEDQGEVDVEDEGEAEDEAVGDHEALLDSYITALVVSSDGIIGKSSKRNLVPFAEMGRVMPGEDYEIIRTEYGWVGISICYDMNSTAIAKLKGRGAEIILAPFNDAGFNELFHRIHSHYPRIIVLSS